MCRALHIERVLRERRQADHEALHVAAEPKQHALARKIDRRDLQALARADDDQRVGG